MKYAAMKDIAQRTELVERLASVTEQLEDIVTITRGKDVKEPKLSISKVAGQMKKKVGGHVPIVLFTIFRMFALKNLLRGRMYMTAYTVGKQLGLSLKINSIADFKKEISKFEIGDMIIKKMDSDGVKVLLDGTITSVGIKNSSHPICYFERGLLSGAAEKLLKKRVDLTEETCCSRGDTYCMFKAVLPSEKRPNVHSSDVISTDLYSKENVKLLTTLASHSITAIENTFLFEEAKKQSVIDALTRVYNHGYFYKMLKIEVNRSFRYKLPLSVIVIDMDRFKNYNDRFGHNQGDKVLKNVASLLVDNVREVDIVARYGGDEFTIILPQTDSKGVKIVINRIRKEMRRMNSKGDARKPMSHLTLSFGAATTTGKKNTKPEVLFEKVDRALFSAKRSGRNRAVFSELK